jgi:RNA polymerase sigma-70 factor, ECF subfamily
LLASSVHGAWTFDASLCNSHASAAARHFLDQGVCAACTTLLQTLLALSSALIPKPTPERSGADTPEREPLRSESRELVRGPEGLAPRIEVGEHCSDIDLARALLAKQPEAAILVQQRFQPLIRRMLRRTLGVTHETEDVEQEVFLNLFSTVYGLRHPAAFRAFVITVTKRTLGHAIRRRRARAHMSVESEQPATELIGDVGDAAARHAFFHFHHLLERLRERERAAFVLRFVERLEAEEIAEALGVSLPTARRSFARAWQRMVVWAARSPFLREYLSVASDGKLSARDGEPETGQRQPRRARS